MVKGREIALAAIFLLMPVFSFAATEVVLSVDEAVAVALRDSRDIMLKAEELKASKARLAESVSARFPTLSFTGAWGVTRGYYSKDSGQSTAQATLKQYLYRGGKTAGSIERDRYLVDVSGALLDKQKLETVSSVRKAFYTLLLADEFSRVNKQILANAREHLESVRARYQNGQASESDIIAIESSLEDIQEAYERAYNQAELAQASLRVLLFVDKDTAIKASGEFLYEPQDVAYDEAFLAALAQRPEIRQYEAKLKADAKAIDVAKAESRPSVYASWDYYSRSHLTATTTRNWNDYNIIGLTFSWPVFDGWVAAHKVEQAVSGLKSTELSYEKTIKDIALELSTAYVSLKNALARIRASESDLKVYKDNFSSAQEKYRSGIVSFLDLSDSELKYAISSFNRKQAVYDYLAAKISFEKATGGL